MLLNGGAISYYASRIYLTNRSFLTEDGPIPPLRRDQPITLTFRWSSERDAPRTGIFEKCGQWQQG
jgi:hypothetical protein